MNDAPGPSFDKGAPDPAYGQQQGQQAYAQPGQAHPPYGQPQYGQQPYPPAQPPYGQSYVQPVANDTTLASAAHWGALVANMVTALGFVVPLVLMLTKGDSSPFVRRHAVESLNFHISIFIYTVVGTVVGMVAAFVTLGLALFLLIPLMLVAMIMILIWQIQGAMRASNGQEWRYPLTIRLVR